MTADIIQDFAPAAEDALGSFLATLLGSAPTLSLNAPTEVEYAALQDGLEGELAVGVEETFVVVLAPSWVELVSESMLGRRIDIDDEGVNDLFREIAAQGYGTLRNQLAAEDVSLPDLSIEPYLPGTAAPSLAETAWRVPFELTHEETIYDGYALLAHPEVATDDPAETADDAAEDAPAFEPEAAPANAPNEGPPQAGQGGVSVSSANFSDLGEEKIHGPRAETNNFELLSEVEIEVSVELGRRRLPLSDVLQLTSGSVIELEKLVGEPLSLYANGRFVAEGEAVVIDEKFGIRITNLAPRNQRSEALM